MRRGCIALLLAAVLLLSGCGHGDNHPQWPEAWMRAGDLLAAETPEAFSLYEYNTAFAANGIWYMSWGYGQDLEQSEHLILDENGEVQSRYFDAQIYLLVKQQTTEEEIRTEIEELWIPQEKKNYSTGEIYELQVGDQRFQVLPLLSGREENPYARGLAAFGLRGAAGISVELLCTEDFSGDLQTLLEQFLAGLHYDGQEE